MWWRRRGLPLSELGSGGVCGASSVERGRGGRSGSAPVVPGGDCSALLAEGCVKLL